MVSSTGMNQDVKTKLQQYLDEKDINGLFVSAVESILISRPEEPVSFIVKYFIDNFPSETHDLVTSLIQSKSKNVVENSEETEDESESDSDESEFDGNEPELPIPVINRGKRRASVCAEKLCPTEVETELKCIPKTEEEGLRIMQILQNNVLFEHLDDIQLKTVHDAMFDVEKDLDDVIIQQGDDGDNFYIIDSGSVEVFIESAEEEDSKLVASYEDGDSFGELAIMYNAPRAASCIAKSKVKLWALDRVSFKIILMKTTITKRNEHKAFLEKVPILSQLTEKELLVIVDSLKEEVFEDEVIICNEGESGDRFFIIKEGTVICSKGDGTDAFKPVARLSSGAYFGEVALMTSKRRQATVRASGALICLSLDRKTFKRVMGPLQDILMRNMEEYNKFQALNI